MRTHQFNLADFNPDAFDKATIRDWLAFIGAGQRPQVAHQWFPGRPGRFALVRAMRAYLWNKLTAYQCREVGGIADALRYEAICERIYSDMPADLRW